MKVSIICIAYNHEKYIRQAIEGFLMQEVSFEYEILIHDDASTDKTADIIKEYTVKHPEKIFAVFQKVNQYTLGVLPSNILIQMARGEYIAICEGDDYWTDNHKLQEQYNILNQHPEYSGCTHNVMIVYEDGSPFDDKYQAIYRETVDKIKDIHFLNDYCKLSHTAGIMFRRSLFFSMSDEQWKTYCGVKANGDMKLSAIMLIHGDVFHIAKDMACYRHVLVGNDSWTARNFGRNITLSTYEQLERIRNFIDKYYHRMLFYDRYYDVLCFRAVTTCVKHPTRENFSIAWTLIKKRKYKFRSFVYELLKKIRTNSSKNMQKQV